MTSSSKTTESYCGTEEGKRLMSGFLSEYQIPEVDPLLVEEAVSNGEFLGKGTFGSCFLLRGATPLCVKVLHIRKKSVADLWCALCAEALQMVRVKDIPGMIRLVGVSLWPTAAIVTEYAGEALSQLLDSYRVSTEDAVEIMKQVAYITSQLTEAGICHADLKSNNIAVEQTEDKEPRVTIIDLGMMQDFGFNPGWEGHRTKIIYAPEIYEGCPLSPATQVYQVGMVFQGILECVGELDYPLQDLAHLATGEAAYRPTIGEIIESLSHRHRLGERNLHWCSFSDFHSEGFWVVG